MAFVEPSLARKKNKKKQSLWQRTKQGTLKIVRDPKLILLTVGAGVAVLFLTAAITYAYFANSLATPEAIINRKNVGVIFYDKDDKEFYRTAGARDTKIIKLDEVSPDLVNATIAIEDHSFYEHGGFSWQSYMRSIISNIKLGDPTAFGGSTITQQLVKNALLSQEKSYIRKFQELVLSIEIDRRYSKDQILELYLTSTYYGSNAYGIDEAAQTYFNTTAKDLTLAQATMLAGLPQAPSAYSPLDGNRELAVQRQHQVIRAMKREGYITQEQQDKLEQVKLTYNQGGSTANQTLSAPHYVQYVLSQLSKKYGEDKMYRSGFRVYTTLDTKLQQTAQEQVKQQVKRLAYAGANNGALVAIDPNNGHLLSMVGSADYEDDSIDGKFNVAIAKTRQPGSATKPFAYLTGFSQDMDPATILHDKPTDFGGYKPQNADRRFRGNVTVRRALANSLNIPAVETVQHVGVSNFIDTMRRAGVDNIEQESVRKCGLAVVLGCAEMPLLDLAHGYATLADQGQYRDLVTYTKIVDKSGQQVFPQKTLGLFDNNPSVGRQVLDRGLVYLITSILSDNQARSEVFGYNSPLKLSRPAAVKTGTTDESKDAWTFGYTPQVVIGVWVGNTDSKPMAAAGATAAAPIWHQVMVSYLKGQPEKEFDRPSTIVELPVCYGRHAIADQAGQNTFMEVFAKSHQPSEKCNGVPKPTPTPSPTATPVESTPSATPIISPTPTPTPDDGGDEDGGTLPPGPTPTPTPNPAPTPTSGGSGAMLFNRFNLRAAQV